MRTIPLADITIPPNRQRKEFLQEDLNELAESISGPTGLLHPPVLRMEYDLANAGKTRYVLVAGERRLRAIEQLFDLGGDFFHNGELFNAERGVPFSLLSDLTPLQRRRAEYEENTQRKDLTWQERAAATAELAALLADEAVAAGAPPPTNTDVAAAAGKPSERGKWGPESTRQEIILAKHLDDPEIRGASGANEAFKILKRKEEAKRNLALAARVGQTFTAEIHTALNTDAIEWLVSAPADSFDVILTDPPYGMGADTFGDSGGAGGSQGEHAYSDDAESFNNLLSRCRTELFRVAKPQAHLYWFCDVDNFHAVKLAFGVAGWWVHRTPLIFHKPTSSRIPWPEHGPQRKYELILYAVKGKRPVLQMARPDVLSYSPDAQLDHAAQKPVALFVDLLKRSARPGDTVLDLFSGTGTIFAAAHECKVAATGIELDPANYAKGVQRIEKLKQQGELPL